VGLRSKTLLVAAALVCATAPAWGSSGANATFVAVDYAWRANGTPGATTLTIAPGQTVTFSYPEGNDIHNLHFEQASPSCPGLPAGPREAPWSNDCTFAQAGSYPFECEIHAGMTGTVVVAGPTPTPSPTRTPTPTPTPPGGGGGNPTTPGATPTPTSGAGGAPPTTGPPSATTLDVKLASRQKGPRVRGKVRIAQAGSRVTVTVRRGKTAAGRWSKGSLPQGTVTFSVALNAKTRAALRSARRLKLSVRVALTPPGAKTLTRTAKATVSL
jgi:plastocyanin